MSRTRNAQKKYEGMMRKLKAKEERMRKEEELKEEEAKKFWSIGAKDESKKQALELKRQEKIARRAMRKKIYEEELGL
uniref:Chain LNN Lso2 n=1 Tax=Paranosema locustae TaxID=235221 RepID=UPI00187D6DEC|nr:Chain LNN, Lso2 [Paranosema locustae]